jgi:hypothetical protein
VFGNVKKLLVAAFMGTIVAGTAVAQQAAKGFTPLLQKVAINGKVFYEVDKVTNQTIKLAPNESAEIEYTFKNLGDKPSVKPCRVFVHFSQDKKNVLGGDFWPAKKTTTWSKDFEFTQKRTVNFKRVNGKTVKMCLGMYVPAAKGVRLRLQNKGLAKDLRFTVGTIVVGSAAAPKATKGFEPLLQKVSINGKVFYEADKVTEQTIEVSSAKPAEIEYTFKNLGGKPSVNPCRAFVHFSQGARNILGGDFWPAKKTTTWPKDFVFAQKRTVNFTKIKGKTVKMLLGMYVPAAKGARLKLQNKGLAKDRRFPVGTITVK